MPNIYKAQPLKSGGHGPWCVHQSRSCDNVPNTNEGHSQM